MRPIARRLLLLACVLPSAAWAQDIHMQGHFQAVRAPAADTRPPAGEVRATVTDDGDVRVDLVVSGMTEHVTSATLHVGDGGESTGQVARMDVAANGGEARVIGGRITLTPLVAQQVRAGNAYVVLHTSEHPDGLLRAQLALQPRTLGSIGNGQ